MHRNIVLRRASRIISIALAALIACNSIAFSDELESIPLNKEQMRALLGETTFSQDGVNLELSGFTIRFLDKEKYTLPDHPEMGSTDVIPLALDETVLLKDFPATIEQKLNAVWNTQLPHSCNEHNNYNNGSLKINKVSGQDISLSFSAYYAKWACWSYDGIKKCEIKWNFQKCETGRIEGSMRILEKTVDFDLNLHLITTGDGISFAPDLKATNVQDIERIISIINFLKPVLQFALGSIFSPTLGLVLALPNVNIIPKLKGPNERIHEIGLQPYGFSLARLKEQQAANITQLSMSKDAAGVIDVGPRLNAMKVRTASLTDNGGELFLALMMATPVANSPSASEAELDRSGLIEVIKGLVRYQESKDAPVSEYVMGKGDSLWSVADKLYGNPYLYENIAAQNTGKHRGIWVGDKIKVRPYHELVDGIDKLVARRDTSWGLADKELGSGKKYKMIQVGDRRCGGPALIYPGEGWSVRSSPQCGNK